MKRSFSGSHVPNFFKPTLFNKSSHATASKKVTILYAVLLTLGLWFLTFFSQAQGTQVAKPYKTTSAVYGYLEYLPTNYNAADPNQKFPLIIFLHGYGETGSGSAVDLEKLKAHGPPKLIAQNKWPVKSPLTGLYPAENFMVFSPQNASGFFNPDLLSKFIDYAKANYSKVDPDRVYLTGLSAGGISIWNYLNKYNNQVAAVIPISGNGNSVSSNACFFKDIPLWAFHGDSDPTVNTGGSTGPVKVINQCVPVPDPKAKVTIYEGVGHDAWTRTYDLTGTSKFSASYDPFNISIYDWLLQYRRKSAVPTPPVANAGADNTITLPTSSLSITGTGTTTTGSITAYSWTKVAGPNATMSSTTSATLSLSNLVEGVYTFRLSVTNTALLTAYDDVNVTVQAANLPPVANAGSDISITLPVNSVSINGTGNDTDGTVVSYQWTKLSTNSVTLSGVSTPTLVASDLMAGSYQFQLTVTDDEGASQTDDVIVTVTNSLASTPPTANAGPDKIVQLQTGYVNLVGSGSDTDGTITEYQWTKVTGGNCTLTNATSATLKASGLSSGTYTFRLTVKDNTSLTAADDVTITVDAPAVVNAGVDQTIQLPQNSIVLAGSATDEDGTVDIYAWTVYSGPAATLVNKNTPTLTANGLVEGTYIFKLSVKDNIGVSSYDYVTVTVQPVATATSSTSGRIASSGTNAASITEVQSAPDLAQDTFILTDNSEEFEKSAVTIYNENGSLIFQGKWSPEMYYTVLNKSGLYLYTVVKEGKRVTGKVYITNN